MANFELDAMKRELFTVESNSPLEQKTQIVGTLRKLDGVGEVEVLPNGIQVSYFPQVVSAGIIRSELTRLGLRRKTPKKRGWLTSALDRMAASNEKEFGNKPPDCCSTDKKLEGKMELPRK